MAYRLSQLLDYLALITSLLLEDYRFNVERRAEP
jgi:hypothetical protein